MEVFYFSMKIRLLDNTEFQHAGGAVQMALDEAIFKEYESKENESEYPITIRFYNFNPSCVTFGYFQKNSTLNHNYIKQNNFEIARRITGGRAVLHHHDLTYSVVVHKSSGFFSESILENYKYVADALLCGLSKLGIKAELHPALRKKPGEERTPSAICFDSPSYLEVKVDDKKFCGSAQNKTTNCFLQHGTIYFDIDPKIHYLCMTPPENLKGLDDEMIEFSAEILKKSMACISELNIEKKPDFTDLAESLKEGFGEAFKFEVEKKSLTESELKRFKELNETKYAGGKWNMMR